MADNFYNSYEFIQVDQKHKKAYSDFTDNEDFTVSERLSFLKKYDEFLQKNYGVPKTSKYAIDPYSAEKMCEQMESSVALPEINERVELKTMLAKLSPRTSVFAGWYSYTDKAKIADGNIRFLNNPIQPSPAAEYVFDNSERLQEIKLEFCISKDYEHKISGGVNGTTYGKVITLRSGIKDIINLEIFSGGEVYSLPVNGDPYHPRHVKIGICEFDRPQSLTVRLGKDNFSIELNGKLSEMLPLKHCDNPDTLFIGAGMFNVGEFTVTPVSMTFEHHKITDFFIPNNKKDSETRFIGEVELPFAIGGYENRRMNIVLSKEFLVEKTDSVNLCIDSLDPGGKVFLNGNLAAETDSFEKFTVNISKWLIRGNNTLEIVVDSRAPEVFAPWHRQADPYTGWFCGKIYLEYEKCIKFENLRAETTETNGKNVSVKFSGETSGKCKLRITAEKIWPEYGERMLIGDFVCSGRFAETVTFTADLWTPETPNIYAVRFTAVRENGDSISDAVIETGFRIIRQHDGRFYLNGKRLILKGALLMQYLPPHDKTPETHVCPSSKQIVWQEMMLKALGGNTLRLHILGYGTNDERYARFADRLGIMLIWTTRYIDSAEQAVWSGKWAAKDGYLRQMKYVINHPSIIMWEGSNEYHPSLNDIDIIYSEFVSAVKTVDKSRLISPISHLYYSADIYSMPGCSFYNCDGTADERGKTTQAVPEWNDELVVKSAHTYFLLLGYGMSWSALRTQDWPEQKKMLESKKQGYIVSEFSVIGRQDPATKEAKSDFFNHYSYEFPNEDVLGTRLNENDWRISQAYQALAAHHAIKRMFAEDIDGMLWCALMGGANDGGYLKPIIDNYGYAKSAFYIMKNDFREVYAVLNDVDTKKGADFTVSPILFGKSGHYYSVNVAVYNEYGNRVFTHCYEKVLCENGKVELDIVASGVTDDGYYTVEFGVAEERQ